MYDSVVLRACTYKCKNVRQLLLSFFFMFSIRILVLVLGPCSAIRIFNHVDYGSKNIVIHLPSTKPE